jgi:hypothetical protein
VKRLTTISFFDCDGVVDAGKSSAILDSCGFVGVELPLLLLLSFNGDFCAGVDTFGDAG